MGIDRGRGPVAAPGGDAAVVPGLGGAPAVFVVGARGSPSLVVGTGIGSVGAPNLARAVLVGPDGAAAVRVDDLGPVPRPAVGVGPGTRAVVATHIL